MPVVEIRLYTLKAGMRGAFHQLVLRASLPLLKQHRIDVLAHGPSLHDDDTYYLLRAYASLEARRQSDEAFYGSAAWREGPRERLLALIESYSDIVLEFDEAAVQALRTGVAHIGKVGI